MKSSADDGAWCFNPEISSTGLFGLPNPLAEHRFVRDWLSGAAPARQLLPESLDDLWSLAAEGHFPATHSTPWAPPLEVEEVEEVVEFNRSVGNAAGAELAHALGHSGTRVVVTGQQPNLFVSPLYILLKAAGAVTLAEHLQERLAQHVIPIFWVASDDHDFAELRDSYFVDREGRLSNLGVFLARGAEIPAGAPAFEWHLEHAFRALSAVLERNLSDGPARRATLQALSNAFAAPATFESVFCRLLAAYLGPVPVVFVTPRMRFLRRRQIPLIRHEIQHTAETNRLVNERGKAMHLAKYHPPLRRRPGDVNFFYLMDRVRARVVRRANGFGFLHPDSGAVLAEVREDKLLELAESHPEHFSPNVVLRPIVQDFSLPVLAYVGGPSEFTYLVQLRDVYSAFSVRRSLPVLRPHGVVFSQRAHSTLSELGLKKALQRHGVRGIIESLVAGDPKMSRLLLELRALEAHLQSSLCSMATVATTMSPHLAVGFEKTRYAMAHALERLRQRLFRQFGETAARKCKALCHVMTELAPAGRPQERVLSPLTFGHELPPAEFGAAIIAAVREGWPEHTTIVVELAERGSALSHLSVKFPLAAGGGSSS